ncbi:MAG: DNA repair protein RecO [Pseudomonadota bacterium]
MEWSESGRILSVRPYGETSVIVEILTRDHGRHPGMVRGGRSRAMRPVLQPGNRVRATWRARLSDHLGNFQIEAEDAAVGAVMEDRLALAGLNAACALALAALPEREAHPRVHDAFEILVASLTDPDIWPAVYVRFEAGLLADLGYGVDLRSCAATGTREGLIYVSPRTGRAVSAEAGEPYKDKLLALPGFMKGEGAIEPGDIASGLKLTGHFLERRLLWPSDRLLPDARTRMMERLEAADRL